jgi:hypothetical protein
MDSFAPLSSLRRYLKQVRALIHSSAGPTFWIDLKLSEYPSRLPLLCRSALPTSPCVYSAVAHQHTVLLACAIYVHLSAPQTLSHFSSQSRNSLNRRTAGRLRVHLGNDCPFYVRVPSPPCTHEGLEATKAAEQHNFPVCYFRRSRVLFRGTFRIR